MQYSHAAIPPYPQVIAADVLTIATDFQTIRLSASYSPVSGNVFVSSPGRDSSDLVFPPSWPGRLAVLPLVLRSSFDVPLTVERITSSDRRIIPILATEADGGAYADDSTLSAYVLYDPFPFCSSKRQRPRKRNFASPSAAHAATGGLCSAAGSRAAAIVACGCAGTQADEGGVASLMSPATLPHNATAGRLATG